MIDATTISSMLRAGLKRRGITNRQVGINAVGDTSVVAVIKKENVYEEVVKEEVDRIHQEWGDGQSSAFIIVEWDRALVENKAQSSDELLNEMLEKSFAGGYKDYRAPVEVYWKDGSEIWEVRCAGRERSMFFKNEDDLRRFIAKRLLERGL